MTANDEKRTMLDRRSFLAATAAATASIGLAGCAPENKLGNTGASESGTGDGGVWNIDAELTSTTGHWQPASCNWSCGGKCLNKVFVEDNIVLRQKTDDDPGDSIDCPQRRACPRGRSQQQMVFGADRLKYPMKRKHWQPGGGENSQGHLRGIDEWERISWDEATDLIAEEFQRVKDAYGNEAFVMTPVTHYRGAAWFIDAFGGMTSIFDSSSFGGANASWPALGVEYVGQCEMNDRYDFKNIEHVVLYGMNPVWASAGNPSYHLYTHAKEAGADFVYVGPSYNPSANLFEARWIQVRPGTDTAFLLAVAYEMFELDAREGNVIDWEYLEKYTYGIDGDHMAPGVQADENFRDYLYGAYDDQVKNAEWASAICGATPEDIRFYADLLRKGNKTYVFFSYGAARCLDAEWWLHLMFTTAWMGGHVGKSGEGCSGSYHAGAFRQPTGAGLVQGGASADYMTVNPVTKQIPSHELYDVIIDGAPFHAVNQFNYMAVEDGDYNRMDTVDLHVMVSDGSAGLNNAPNTNRGIEAWRKLDFVVSTGWNMTPQCWYADIVLPIQTQWEWEAGRVFSEGSGQYTDTESVYLMKCVIDPLYEAMDNKDIWDMVGAKLGLTDFRLSPNRRQEAIDEIAAATYLDANGEWKPLVTITQEDLDRWDVTGTPQEGDKVTLSELEEKGIYKLPRSEGDAYSSYRAFQAYIDDPEGNPRGTASGRWEIHSPGLADFLNGIDYSDGYQWRPYPSYKPAKRGYEEGQAGAHKFQVFNPHYIRRQHSISDNLPWLREGLENPVWINASDAAELGIETGDTVRLFNDTGAVLRQASVTNAIMPGVLSLPHGAWIDMDEELQVDRGGNPNTLIPSETSGSGVNGYNTTLVSVEKWTGDALDRDCEWPQRIIDAQA